MENVAKRWGKHVSVLAMAALLLSLALPGPVLAAGIDQPPTPPAASGSLLGIVRPRGQSSSPLSFRTSNLSYHNGPVMRTNTVYAIYWIPSGFRVSANYQSLINGFFQNVAADNGKTTNVYYSDTQYYDTTGSIAYNSTLGGAWLDTSAYPANGCTDSYTSVCLSDAQLQTEVSRAISANGWTAGPTHMFFVFTPQNVGSCSGSSCAYSQFCAYHGWFGSGSTVTLYANQPYAMWVPSACDSGQHPNGDDADATINVVSHEHNEGITDEQGSAWYDRRGYENGDKCAWNFGTSLGSTTYGQYNQVIGTGKYYLQQEWSNYSSKCVLTGK